MKIVIIGSGLLGVTTAYFLSREGHEVTVIDRRDSPGMETSFANAGMITPSQADPWNHPGIIKNIFTWLGREDSPFLLRPRAAISMFGWGIDFIRNSSRERYLRNMRRNAILAGYSLRVLQSLRQDSGIRYDESCMGTMKLFGSSADLDAITEFSHLYQELEIHYQILDPAGVLALEPALAGTNTAIVGGIHYPNDESGDAHKFCRALAELARKQGVTFHYGMDVLGLDHSGSRVSGVRTRQERVTGDTYVLAAGSYSTLIARSVGLHLPVRPVKGYSLTIDVSDWEGRPSRPVVDESMHVALTPLGTRLRVAGTAELAGYNTEISRGRIGTVNRILTRIYPGIHPYLADDRVEQWTGLRPYSSDGVPLIGATPLENLYLNTGHGHLGWTMAAGSGQLLADSISGRKPAIDIEAYRLGR